MKRYDEWAQFEDRLLAESILSNIENGSTILKACDKVGRILNRSSAACAFRWYGVVKERHTERLQEARRTRYDARRFY